MLPLCHINIRSIKANLPSFEICLDNLKGEFSAIGVSETWLQDSDCSFYNIEGYNLIENHRNLRRGGGVAIFLKRAISYQKRTDLELMGDSYESVFIEIDKDTMRKM